MDFSQNKLTDDEFYSIRNEILSQWPTGAKVDFDEAVEYHKSIPESKSFSKKLLEAKKNNKTLIQPRAGVALPHEHIELLQYLENEGEADLLPTTIDAYTRLNRYEDAQHGIDESRKKGRSLLNGFPAVNHGVNVCREVTSSLESPVQVRHGTPDARLLAEITIAGGFTSFEGGGISYNIPYSKNHSIETTVKYWQYVDRLVGKYEEAGISINREPFGPLTGTLVPPCISSSIAILEAILAAFQGVKNITVGYGQCGNLIQDIATIKSLLKQTNFYLYRYGFSDIEVTTVLHQWMGGFPADESKAFAVISMGSAAAALSHATKVIVKTPHEAYGIPTKEANAAGLKATKQVVHMLQDQDLLNIHHIGEECEILEKEVECIISKVESLGEGDIALGIVRAFEAGVLDVPFAPSKYNRGKVMPARDDDGAIRLLDIGNLPFTKDIIDFHREKLEKRGRAEGREVTFNMTVDDVYAVGLGYLVGRSNKK